MNLVRRSSPHLAPANSVSLMMRRVLYALIPATIAYVWFFGWGLIFNMIIASAVCLGAEALMLKLRQRPLQPFIMDYSAVVTAVLLAFALPPLAPWWITAFGSLFAIVFAKHLYGGLGYNVFNPAMVGYVVLLISFPVEMTRWLPPETFVDESLRLGPLQTLMVIVTGQLPDGVSWDAISQATPLDLMKTEIARAATVSEVRASPLFGDFGGRGWEWIGNWVALGGLWLLYLRVIRWQIPIAMVGAVLLVSGLFHVVDPDHFASPGFHLFSGATLLGAFFIATDPVSAATTPRGRLIYGAGIGLLTYLIRTFGGYPDAVAFAVLLMNMAVPLIDHFTKPRTYGHGTADDG